MNSGDYAEWTLDEKHSIAMHVFQHAKSTVDLTIARHLYIDDTNSRTTVCLSRFDFQTR